MITNKIRHRRLAFCASAFDFKNYLHIKHKVYDMFIRNLRYISK